MSSFQRLQQLPKRCTALYNNGSRRQYAQGAVAPEDLPMLLEQGKLKPFDSIPGPRAKFLHRILGSHSLYWPLIGKYSKTEQKETYTKFYHEFGPVVKEYVQSNYPIIHIYDPADMQVVFRNEGMYPARRSHLVLEKYRLSKPEYYNSGGVLPTNGPVWKHLRSNFQRNFTRPTDLSPYLQDIQEITEEFIAARIRPGIVEDCHQEISRLFLELTALVAFDERFNAFTEAELSPMSRSSQLMRSASTVNGCVMKTNNDLQLWDKVPWLSRTYRELVEAHKGVEKIALEQVTKKLAYMQNMAAKGIANDRTPRSLLEYYLTLTQVDIKDIMGMTVDLLLGGVDTVTSTSSFLLYHIARNPIEQEKVFEEACALIPNKNTSMMDPETLDKAKRTRNAIRESFRLNPISIGVGRILPVDVNLGGYHVPKGTHIVTQNQVACSLAKNFDDPDVFMPDRWDKRVYTVEDNMKVTRGAYHPFASIPFSHGARTCIARRLAEINMQTFLLRVLRRYKLVWAGDREVGIRTVLVHHPDKPIRVRFLPRDN